MRLHMLALIAITHVAHANEPQIMVWSKLDTRASRAVIGEIACALDARAVVDGKNRPIDIRIGEKVCADHADGIKATVRTSGTDPLHVVVEMTAPEGTTNSGMAELDDALKETTQELSRRAEARVAPPVVVVSADDKPSEKKYEAFVPTPYTGGPLPEGTTIERRANMDVVWIGLAGFGAAYAGSVLYAMATCGAQQGCRQGSEWLYVPGFGPFVTAAQAPTTGGATLAVFDGVIQNVGLGLAAAGIWAFPKKFVVSKSVSMDVKPMSFPAGAGVGVTVTTL